ncbi:MAG: nucleotide exchange factor GrpE [Minisyncoccia bacterium]
MDEKLPTEDETVKELQETIEKLKKENEDLIANLKKMKVEHLNYQKEAEEKMKNIIYFANAGLILELLPVLDSLDLATNSLSDDEKEKNLGKGYYMIQAQIWGILKRYGLEVIDPKGEKFDPKFHEAISTKKCDKENCDKSDDNLIIEVLAKGYKLNDQLLRPAKVKVIVH